MGSQEPGRTDAQVISASVHDPDLRAYGWMTFDGTQCADASSGNRSDVEVGTVDPELVAQTDTPATDYDAAGVDLTRVLSEGEGTAALRCQNLTPNRGTRDPGDYRRGPAASSSKEPICLASS